MRSAPLTLLHPRPSLALGMWTAHITEEEEMSGTRWAARIGAIFYILWGVFHLMAAKAVFGLADLANGMTRARLQQDAFYPLAFAVAGMAIARAEERGVGKEWGSTCRS